MREVGADTLSLRRGPSEAMVKRRRAHPASKASLEGVHLGIKKVGPGLKVRM